MSKIDKAAKSIRKFFGVEEEPKRESWDAFEYDESETEKPKRRDNGKGEFGGELGKRINKNIKKHRDKKRKGRKLSGTWIGDPDDDEKKA